MKRLKLSVALNGSKWGKGPSVLAPKGVPDLPCSVEEALQDTAVCYRLGARQFHVHSRAPGDLHVADAAWYRKFTSSFRQQFPDASLCLATSRSGEVINQISHRESILRQSGCVDECKLLAEAEKIRLACIEPETPFLPDYVTGFTATEVRMFDEDTDIGHVSSAQSPAVTHMFYDELTKQLHSLNIGQEIEITTRDSMDIVEKIQAEQLIRTHVRLVLLPEFTPSLSGCSRYDMSELVLRARRVIDKTGHEGDIVMGVILRPGTPHLEDIRRDWIAFAVDNPLITALRIGLEDCPVLYEQPATNESLTHSACHLINEYGGEITPLA